MYKKDYRVREWHIYSGTHIPDCVPEHSHIRTQYNLGLYSVTVKSNNFSTPVAEKKRLDSFTQLNDTERETVLYFTRQ